MYFVESEPSEVSDIIGINVAATVRVTRMVLPGMVNRYVLVIAHPVTLYSSSARKNGLVLNIGSFSSIVPSPMLATYSGTKAFVDTFSTALAEEVKNHGVTVQCINPYFVVSGIIRSPVTILTRPRRCLRCLRSGSPP